MNKEKFYESYTQMIKAIAYCVQNHLSLPALAMIYTCIDSVSWLANNDPTIRSGKAFKIWVAEWMLKTSELKCSSEELYAARCGLLHTLTPISESTKKGVRKIAYSWGSAENENLAETISRLGMNEEIASIHLETLFSTFREGMANYLDYVHSHPELEHLFWEKSNLHFVNISNHRLNEFLAITNNKIV